MQKSGRRVRSSRGVLGLVVAALLALQRETLAERPSPHHPGATRRSPQTHRLKVGGSCSRRRSSAISFLVLLAVMSGGLQNYSVVALNASYDTPIAIGNTALTAFLLLNALGVLAGGLIVARTSRHAAVRWAASSRRRSPRHLSASSISDRAADPRDVARRFPHA